MRYRLIAIIGFMCLLTSCKICRESVIPVKHLDTDFGCPDTRHSLSIDLTDICTIIQNKADYDNKVSGTCHPEINFDLYYLVIGKQSTTKEVDTIYYDFGISCPENDLTLNIEIVQGDAAVPDNVVYHALIPKQENPEPIVVNVKVK